MLAGPESTLPSPRELESRSGPAEPVFSENNLPSPTQRKLKHDGTIPCPGLLSRLSPSLDLLEVLDLGRFALAGYELSI